MKKNLKPMEYEKLKAKLSDIRTNIYKNIILPNKDNKSDAIIYRM
jgi:hypothetical protein